MKRFSVGIQVSSLSSAIVVFSWVANTGVDSVVAFGDYCFDSICKEMENSWRGERPYEYSRALWFILSTSPANSTTTTTTTTTAAENGLSPYLRPGFLSLNLSPSFSEFVCCGYYDFL